MTNPQYSGHTDLSAYAGRPINGALLLTIAEAAKALHISRSSIYRLFDGGELAWVQIAAHTEAAC